MIWRPFTQEKNALSSIKIISGEGAYLISESKTKYLDMIASWWVNIHGHSNHEIANAISEQAKKLDHVIFTKFSHEPAEKLDVELRKILPVELNYCFFSDNGSTAVEVALKMAYQFFQNNGDKKRKIFLSLNGAYHGDTFGAMSLGGEFSKYHATFSKFFFDTISIDVPESKCSILDCAVTYNNEMENAENVAIEKLEKALSNGVGETCCALIVEPVVQGAYGMRVYRAIFLEKLSKLMQKYGILVIFDEVMTGFYRTGKIFAMNHTNVVPDLLCLSKGLTGGFLPIALTVTNHNVFSAFLSDDDNSKAFMHGHSYTANPISCAAACKSIEILLRENTKKQVEMIEKTNKNNLTIMQNVMNKRLCGTIAAFDMKTSEDALFLTEKLFENGIFLRPLGKSIYILPPYCVSENELNYVYSAINKNL